MVVYSRGETYIQKVTIRDEDNVLFNPDEVKWTITDPNGTIVVNEEDMLNVSTGVYKDSYNIPDDAPYGNYRVKIEMIVIDIQTTIKEDEFFILPIKLEDVKQVSGIVDERSISDRDFSQLLWHAYQITLKESLINHRNEKPKGNPDTGVWLDGSNTTFQVRHPPLADANGDGAVDGYDLSGIWIDEDYNIHQLLCGVINAREGIITLQQLNGSPIPNTAKKVEIDYFQEPPRWDEETFRKAVIYLASHLAQMRLKEPSRITIADLTSNRVLLEERHTEFSEMYWRLMRGLSGGAFGVT